MNPESEEDHVDLTRDAERWDDEDLQLFEEVSPDADSSPPPAPPQPAPPPGSPEASAPPPVRDAIFIAGVQGSGKTVVLARLFHELDISREDPIARHGVELKASPTNLIYLNTIVGNIHAGQWPDNTKSHQEIQFTARWNGGMTDLVYFDFPGEVFVRAFRDGAGAPGSQEARLRESMNRARHVLLLSDPAQLLSGEEGTQANKYALEHAIEYLQGTPGGSGVGVTICLTKFDRRRALLAAHIDPGWPKHEWRDRLAMRLVPQLWRRVAPTERHLAWVTAFAERTVDGRSVPDPESSPGETIALLKRVIHSDLLSAMRNLRRTPASALDGNHRESAALMLGTLDRFLELARRLHLDPRHFPEVYRLRATRNHVQAVLVGGRPGELIRRQVDEYRSIRRGRSTP